MDSIELFKVAFTKRLFADFNDYEIEYVVLAGLDNFPSKIGRDIDLYLPYCQLEKIITLTKKLFTSSEWDFVWFNDTGIGVLQNFWAKFTHGRICLFQIDYITDTQSSLIGAAPTLFFKNVFDESKIYKTHGIRINWELYFLKSVVRKYYLTGIKKEFPAILSENGFSAASIQHSAKGFTRQILQAYSEDINLEIDSSKNNLFKRKLRLNLDYFITNPHKFLINLVWRLPKKKLKSFLKSNFFSVSVLGPDGVGKSTLLDAIRTIFEEKFQIHNIHFRPQTLDRFLKRSNHAQVVDPHSDYVKTTQTKSGAIFRVFYFLCDFWLFRIYFKFLISGSRNTLVIFDRGSQDPLVDPIRYRLRSSKYAQLVSKYAPKSDFQLALEDSPEAIYSRKNELNIEEIKLQLNRLYDLKSGGIINKIYKSDLSLAPNVAVEIVERLSSRIQKNNLHVYKNNSRNYTLFINGKMRLVFLNGSPSYEDIISRLGWNGSFPRVIYFWYCVFFKCGRIKIHKNFSHIYSPLWKLIYKTQDCDAQVCCIFPVNEERKRVTIIDSINSRVTKIGMEDDMTFLFNELKASDFLNKFQWQNFKFKIASLKAKSDKSVAIETQEIKNLAQIEPVWSDLIHNIFLEIHKKKLIMRRSSEEELKDCQVIFSHDFCNYHDFNAKFGSCHGDFTFGNIYQDAGGDIYVLDWEYFSTEAPWLVDPLIFHIDLGCSLIFKKKQNLIDFCRNFAPNNFEVALALRWLMKSGRLDLKEAKRVFMNINDILIQNT